MFISAFTSVKLTFNATVKRRLRAVSQAFYCAERLPSILHDAQAPALGTVVGTSSSILTTPWATLWTVLSNCPCQCRLRCTTFCCGYPLEVSARWGIIGQRALPTGVDGLNFNPTGNHMSNPDQGGQQNQGGQQDQKPGQQQQNPGQGGQQGDQKPGQQEQQK